MKKAFVLLIAVIMLLAIPVEAFAEAPDFSAMTDEELHEYIGLARNELKKRELNAEGKTILFEQDNVTVYLTGDYRIYGSDNIYIAFETVVVNDSDVTASVVVDTLTLNGWDVYGSGISGVTAHHKKKDELSFNLTDAEISSFEEIEEVEWRFYLYDSDAWDVISYVDPIIIHFN